MDPSYIPFMGMAIPIIIVPVALGMRHARRLAEMEHVQKMRALELGRVVDPVDEPWSVAAYLSLAIGAGVPVAALAAIYYSSRAGVGDERVWMICGMVALAGVICGTVLATQFLKRGPAEVSQKPAYDPDAYESVGR